jgi:hypothetical protein
MTLSQANQLIDEIYNEETNYPRVIEGRMAMAMFEVTHKEYTFDQIRNTIKEQFDWNSYSNRLYPDFMATYKKKLFELIDNATFRGSGSESDYSRQ